MFLFEVCRMVVKPERVRASQPKSHTGVHAIALQLATFSLLVKEVKVIVVRGSQLNVENPAAVDSQIADRSSECFPFTGLCGRLS